MTNEPTQSPQEIAITKRSNQKQARLERVTEHFARLSNSHPEAYEIINDILDIQLEAQDGMMYLGDTDFIFKLSGGRAALLELKEKLNTYVDYS